MGNPDFDPVLDSERPPRRNATNSGKSPEIQPEIAKMAAFIPDQDKDPLVIAVNDQGTVVPLTGFSSHIQLLSDSDTLLFVKWGQGPLTADQAKFPIAPGAFGSFLRGAADTMALRAQPGKTGTVYVISGREY